MEGYIGSVQVDGDNRGVGGRGLGGGKKGECRVEGKGVKGVFKWVVMTIKR